MKRLTITLLLLVFLLNLDTSLLTLEPTPAVLVVSNSVDMPAAVKLRSFLQNIGFSAGIVGAADFDEKFQTCDIAVILGGPDAYELVGTISSRYLSGEDQSYLRREEEAKVFRVVDSDSKQIIVLAGHTRVETAEAVDLFIENWYLETDVFLLSSENILYVLMGRFTQFSTYNYTIVASSGRGISINMRKILDIEKYGRTQRVLEAGITSGQNSGDEAPSIPKQQVLI